MSERAPSDRPLRIAAVGDLHGHGGSAAGGPHASWIGRFDGIEEEADVLLLAGDLTASGQVREAEAVVQALATLPLKKVAVLGNHELDHGQQEEVMKVFRAGGITVLDGDDSTVEIGSVGIVGCKGFCGGFGAATLAPFGE